MNGITCGECYNDNLWNGEEYKNMYKLKWGIFSTETFLNLVL